MKQRKMINNANSWIINVYAFSKVHQIIEIRDRHSNEKVCDDLIMHATVLFSKSYKSLSLAKLNIIRQVIIEELKTYEDWDDVPVNKDGEVILY